MIGPSTPATVIDARWLGYSGIGSVTESLLRGLHELAPAGRWLIWGPSAAAAFTWPAASWIGSRHPPTAWMGQRERMPAADRTLALHLVRPLLSRRVTAVLAHDTIPVRWKEPAWQRPLQRAFYALSVRRSVVVLAYSDATVDNLRTDLGFKGPVQRVRLPIDTERAERVRHLRAVRPVAPPRLLYVGIDRPHKNLQNAITAFATTAAVAAGATFHLVGIQPTRVAVLEAAASAAGIGDRVVVRPRLPADDLDTEMLKATALIQPSFEEGLGLTVVEALAAGIPVCCSDRPALVEAAAGQAVLFDPGDLASIARAVDHLLVESRSVPSPPDVPSPQEFARRVIDCLDEGLPLGDVQRRRRST